MAVQHLVREPGTARRDERWDTAGTRVLAHDSGFLRVLGGPGTGKTTLLAELTARRLLAGDAEQVLVLTASRRAALALRSEITDRRRGGEAVSTVTEPLVRTVHSYAFAVLRRAATLRGEPPPRLLSGPEQDTVVRELLAGDLATGAGYWPAALRPALSLPGFAAELRDLLLRAAERGLGPEDLARLGRREGRPEWVAAATFWRQYEQVTQLAGGGRGDAAAPALDAAELVAAALAEFDTDEALLAAERARVRRVHVDDAQHLDPLQWRLVRALGDAAEEFVCFGDVHQSVFAFRGADPSLLADADPTGAATATLRVSHRCPPAVRRALAGLDARLPGAGRSELTAPPNEEEPGRVEVRVLASEAAQAAWIADELRRAHLIDGVPYAEMAVLARSVPRVLPVLRRALSAAGVPVATPAAEVPPAQVPAVRPLLDALRVAAHPEELTEERAETLLSSPLGGADPLAQRKLRRELRRLELAAGGSRASGELLVEALLGGDVLTAVAASTAAPLRRLARVLEATAEALPQGLPQALWELWHASGLEERWADLSAQGGYPGAQADRDLDAVLALFDATTRYTERLPRAGVSGFLEHLTAQRFAGDSLAERAPQGDAVTVCSAHAAVGREWHLVAIAGLDDGIWPDLRLRGSLLGVERLVDRLSGIGAHAAVSETAPLLAEERRLLRVAASRTRHTLLVGAVRNETEQPSGLLDELDPRTPGTGGEERPLHRPRRGLQLAELVGELRAAVCDGGRERAERAAAAHELARLAAAGVPGAHPDSWYGLPEISTDRPLQAPDAPITVSPSTLEVLRRCPLRWLLARHGGENPAELPAIAGSLVHALTEAVAAGASREEAQRALRATWQRLDTGAPWFSRREADRLAGMLDTFEAWVDASRDELTFLAAERDIEVDVPAPAGGLPVRVRGRVDRLERDEQGQGVVVDLKTGKQPVTGADAAAHPQLAVYQLAVLSGAFGDLLAETAPGGARLLYLAKANQSSGATQRAQPAMDSETAQAWLAEIRRAAEEGEGPEYRAAENADCPRCPVRACCPLQDAGRQVSQ